jgi:heterodisulfide reductase subunit B
MLRDTVGFDNIAKAVKNPLKGRKIAAYYGCLLLRPGKVMQMDDPENPTILEDFIRALGAEPVLYAQRNECCGAYVALEDAAVPKKRSEIILENAKANGAEVVLTACPLCLYNLKKNGGDTLPVMYFTELLAEALGVK